jgi:hypothetical protein
MRDVGRGSELRNHGGLRLAETELRPHSQRTAQGGAKNAAIWHWEGKHGRVDSMPGRPEPE